MDSDNVVFFILIFTVNQKPTVFSVSIHLGSIKWDPPLNDAHMNKYT